MTPEKPMAPPKRRWLTFSLRGAFIVLTLFCIWIAAQATRARKQQEGIGKVEKLGGYLRFDYQEDSQGNALRNGGQPSAPEWLRNAVGEEHFRRVATVDLAVGEATAADKDLAVFEDLTDLTTLELGGNPAITDAGLVHLKRLKDLRTLYLYRTNVTGAGIQHLPRRLEGLSLTSTPLGDEGLAYLRRKSKLKWLQLANTHITDQGLAALSGLLTLEHLNLCHTDITDAGLDHLTPLVGLKQLSLFDTKVTGHGVARLKKALPKCRIIPAPELLLAVPEDIALWPDGYKPTIAEVVAKVAQLKGLAEVDKNRPGQPIVSLTLFDSNISDESLLALLVHTPELEQLVLRHVLVGSRLAKGLPRLSKLTYLVLGNSRIADGDLRFVGQMKELRELELFENGISDAGIKHLAGLANLRTLHTYSTRVTDAGRSKLQKLLPKCWVN